MNAEETVFNCILTRRSVRKYRPDKIPDEMIEKIITAGINAPSALSKQPWRFLVVSDADLLKRMSDFIKPQIYSNLKNDSSSSTKNILKWLVQKISRFFTVLLIS